MYAADSRHRRAALQDKLQHLYTLRSGPAIDLTIRPDYYELLKRLGDPHKKLPPVIHVAGTNGKGSTIATLRAILEAAGRKVHVYTSPHLRRFNERVVLAGAEITDDYLESLIDEATAHSAGLKLTFFEITTAVAFAAFARTKADIVLLETGLGGRLDCTNVVEKPLATIITAIGFDHMEFLGDTLVRIAAEKAGIMKADAPCVIAPQTDKSIDHVFADRASQLDCVLWRGGREWRAEESGGLMVFTSAQKTMKLPLPALAGPHQVQNAGAALACLLAAGIDIDQKTIAEGLRRIHWPARLQRLRDPAPRWELWLDGAHNEHGAQALALQMAQWEKQDGKPVHLIFGIMQRKDAAAFLRPLAAHTASITAVPIAGEPLAHTPESLAAALRDSSIQAPGFAASPEEAVRRLTKSGKSGRILIAGSLYLAGQILGAL